LLRCHDSSGRFAAGAAAHGGCVEVLLNNSTFQPPSDAAPVQVGSHQGYMVSDAAKRSAILVVELSATAQGGQELVVSARNLSQKLVIEIAARALDVPYGSAQR
jgi:hypothetical protein